ncbi:DUF6530 family protein [Desulfosarcina sp. OttesenSCG-928-A07]|nr:DUF6530 family protein [Desulfosarcina sp. OttesenSCG-928-G17]MDL2328295.1 DUF6530 family protein [Desulfosarcina sp. OttesenSCG-928-A07]
MKIPTALKHKPVVCAEEYARIDGKYADHTDAKGLSLGLAQWNDRGNVDISAKIWRHSGEKWSRQSEEMPMHRVLDLAIMICKTYAYFKEAYRIPGLYKPDQPEIDAIELQGAKTPLTICADNPMIEGDIQLFAQALRDEGERLGERFKALAAALKESGYY